jgi:hypothetical protein
MNLKSKKLLSLFLVFSLVAISCSTVGTPRQMRFEPKKQKHGTNLVILKKDGRQIRSELIAVKENSLLLLESESGAGVFIDIGDVWMIKIVKKSKFLLRTGQGLLVGGGVGLLVGNEDQGLKGILAFFSITILGAIIGGMAGVNSGIDKIIQIEGMSDSEIQETLHKLRKKARIRDYK